LGGRTRSLMRMKCGAPYIKVVYPVHLVHLCVMRQLESLHVSVFIEPSVASDKIKQAVHVIAERELDRPARPCKVASTRSPL